MRHLFSMLLAMGIPTGLVFAQAAVPPDLRVTTETFEAHAADGAALGRVIVTNVLTETKGRPILFAFNGGPGAASAWLSLGALGPVRVEIPTDPAAAIPADPELIDNPETIATMTDLVLIDPLGTGFSRVSAGTSREAVFDWRGDGGYIAELIRDWLKRHNRIDAPIYLLGESYGTERAVAVAEALTTGDDPANLSGVILVSQSITVENTLQRPGNDLGTAVGLPTLAAIACYFHIARQSDTPNKCAERAHAFATGRYISALSQGAALSARERARIENDLAAFTGLPRAYFAEHGLAVTKDRYRRDALATRGLLLGVYDARYTAQADPGRENQDPSFDGLRPAMESAARRFYRDFAGLTMSPIDNTPYIMLADTIGGQWGYGAVADPFTRFDLPGVLARALRRTGGRLFIAGGLFDTAGSFGADRYLASHIDLPADTLSAKSYSGGHMFYYNARSRADFVHDIQIFLSNPPKNGSKTKIGDHKIGSNLRP